MTDWTPDLSGRTGPKYLAIADVLARDLRSHRLKIGARLPTHRALARRLGLTVGTVSRAYAEAERRGLTVGEVGRGTFVKDPGDLPSDIDAVDYSGPVIGAAVEEGLIDLAVNHPLIGPQRHALARTLQALSTGPDAARMLTYQPDQGVAAHRRAGAAWLAARGLEVPSGRVVVTAGGQHALFVALSLLARPGASVLAETLTYSGFQAAARQLDLKVHGVLMDEQGLLPDSLELACWSSNAKVLYCMPTLQNPTNAVMTAERRGQVLEIVRRYDLTVIEDDVCGVLHAAAPPPLSAELPDKAYFISSLSKGVAPGLRTGFMAVPEDTVEAVARIVRSTTWMAPTTLAEVAARWIEDGTAERQLTWQRRQASRRQDMAAQILGGHDVVARPDSLHLWLKLPPPWTGDSFADAARERGLAVSPARLFSVGRSAPPACVRLCLGACADEGALRQGFQIAADLLMDNVEMARSAV